jgi:hypothetical protein
MIIAFVAVAFLVGYFGVTYVMNKVKDSEEGGAWKDRRDSSASDDKKDSER